MLEGVSAVNLFLQLTCLLLRSGQSVLHAHSEQAVVVHACHGHRYQPSLVPLSGTVIAYISRPILHAEYLPNLERDVAPW